MKNEDTVLRILAASYALMGEKEMARTCARRLKEIYPDQKAIDMVGISPDQDPDITKRFIEGLQLAGIS